MLRRLHPRGIDWNCLNPSVKDCGGSISQRVKPRYGKNFTRLRYVIKLLPSQNTGTNQYRLRLSAL